MKIAILGLGRVATADALAFARTHEVVMTGPLPDRIDAINRGDYGLNDPAIATYLESHRLNLRADPDIQAALAQADAVFISTPISRNTETDTANLAELDSRIELAARHLPHAPIVVRSAVPVGYCEAQRATHKRAKIVYAPVFSREGHMLTDLLNPRFLIVGDRHAPGRQVLEVLKTAAYDESVQTRQMGLTEAELTRNLSILFQAARVNYFNELDSYALHHNLNARQIIDGVCLDPRVGKTANNPCFGYEHQTLQLSTQILGSSLDESQTPILACLEKAHAARVDMLTQRISAQRPATIGIYVQRDIDRLPQVLANLKARFEAAGITTRIQIGENHALEQFKSECEIVLTQRDAPELADIKTKVFTRDHYASV